MPTVLLIQVCTGLEPRATREREISALLEGLEELHLEKALNLTENEEEIINIKNKTIQVTPVYKWLLDEKVEGSRNSGP